MILFFFPHTSKEKVYLVHFKASYTRFFALIYYRTFIKTHAIWIDSPLSCIGTYFGTKYKNITKFGLQLTIFESKIRALIINHGSRSSRKGDIE